MSAVLNTNTASLWAAKNLLGAQNRLAASVERLSSGLRINRARDDAAGLGVANSLTAQINGANQGMRNLNDAISMVQTAEGAIAAASDMGQRILMLATQGANGTLGIVERRAIQSEMVQLLSSLDSIGARTNFSGNPLLGKGRNQDVDYTAYSMQISNTAADSVGLENRAFYSIGWSNSAFAETGQWTINSSISVNAAATKTFVLKGVNTDGTDTANMSRTLTLTGAAGTGTVFSASDIAAAFADGFVNVAGSKVVANGSDFNAAWAVTASGNKITVTSKAPGTLAGYNLTLVPPGADPGSSSNDYYDEGAAANTTGQGSTLRAAVFTTLGDALTASETSGETEAERTAVINAFMQIQTDATNYVTRLGTQRGLLGAYQNQMEYTLANITELSSNLSSARSRVIDTDYASETAMLTRGQILQQAATAMLAQANQMPNVILTLLK